MVSRKSCGWVIFVSVFAVLAIIAVIIALLVVYIPRPPPTDLGFKMSIMPDIEPVDTYFKVFNASVHQLTDGRWITFARHSNAFPHNPHLGFRYISDLYWAPFDFDKIEAVGDWRIAYVPLHPCNPCPIDGAEDVRAFIYEGRDYMIFNTQTDRNECIPTFTQIFIAPFTVSSSDNESSGGESMSIGQPVHLWCKELKTKQRIEKNWGAWVNDNTLYFLYGFDYNDLVILRCDNILTGKCSVYSRLPSTVPPFRKLLYLGNNGTQALLIAHRRPNSLNYFNVFILMDLQYPHTVQKISREFKLNHPHGNLNYEYFEYVMQAVIHKQSSTMLLSGGISDRNCFYSSVPLSYLTTTILDDAGTKFANFEEFIQ